MRADCVICGKTFEKSNGTAKTCGKDCGKVLRRASQRNFDQTPQRKEYKRKYSQSPKYKEYRRKRRQSPEYKEYQREYSRSPQRKEYMRKYRVFYGASKLLAEIASFTPLYEQETTPADSAN